MNKDDNSQAQNNPSLSDEYAGCDFRFDINVGALFVV
jgi:hypothetical protein